MAKIAFFGTGTMGTPMAQNLARAGFELRAWNRSVERARPLGEEGAQVIEDLREAPGGADVLITMLSDREAVLNVAEEALSEVDDPPLWLQMSTIGVSGAEQCAELAKRAGVSLVDAPVLGTRQPAEQANLVILASGPDDARQACEPIFKAIGSRTLWLGDAGAGTRCKVMINSWVVGVVGVLAETIALSEALDIDPRHFFEAVAGGPLDLPYAQMKGQMMMEHSFGDPAFRLALSRKDAELVLEAAARHCLELPIMQAVTDRLRRAERDGHGEEDMAATYWASVPSSVESGSG